MMRDQDLLGRIESELGVLCVDYAPALTFGEHYVRALSSLVSDCRHMLKVGDPVGAQYWLSQAREFIVVREVPTAENVRVS